MKKNKNQAYTKPETKPAENKANEKIVQCIPSEKTRVKDKTAGELPFKKILYGYDPDEVTLYISELSDSYEASARIHESKLSSIKEELVLSNRERDSYIRKFRDCTEKLGAQAAPAQQKEDKSAEYEAVIASLKEKLELAETEKMRLAKADNSELLNGYLGRIAVLEEENRALSSSLQASERENAQLLAAREKYDALLGDYNMACAELELSKAETASKEKENTNLHEELENKIDELNSLACENEDIKKKSAELEAENGVLSKCLEECRAEILNLKESNKMQAYEYADKINALESDHAKADLAIKKELKLHDYYMNQAENTLAQLTAQIEQIKQSTKNMRQV